MTSDPIFSGEEFIDQIFDGMDGRAAKVHGRQFEGCTFLKCSFSDIDFANSKFMDCSFQDCDLSNMQIRGATLRDSLFINSKLIGITWPQATAIVHVKFQKCVLNYSSFVGLDLRKSEINECAAKEADFTETNLAESDLRGTDFTGARFGNTNLMKADLRRAFNYSIRPLENKIAKAKFSLPEATLLLHGLNIVLED